MKPVFIPPFIGSEIKSGAESRMFEALKKFRMENAYILHSLGLPRHANKIYGEIDFVVICARGVACLEIKGGTVKRHGGKWIYKRKDGRETVKSESPFAQAVGNMCSLREELAKRFAGDPELGNVPVACGVIFPDIVFNDRSQEVIPEIIYDKNGRGITGYINRIFDYWINRRGCGEKILSEENICEIKDFLRGDFCFVPMLSDRLDDIESGLVRLTKEQWRVMSALSENDRLMIEGTAGTGKTLLALDFAGKKAAQSQKVLYLTYNKNLAANLQRKAGGVPNLEIINIHALFGRYVEVDSGMIADDPDRYFSEILPLEFRKHLDSLPGGGLADMQYDVFVVDEGQDVVNPVYLNAVDPLLKGGLEQGKWVLFYDKNQNIYNPEYQNGLNQLLKYNTTKFQLFTNCRNTAQIASYCEEASGIKLCECIVDNGEKVREIRFKNDDDFKARVTKIINELKAGGVKCCDIMFLSPKRYQNSVLARVGVAVAESNAENSGDPCFSTIQSFKGLDSKVVVLCDLELIPEENYSKFIYIAATRARTLLYVMKIYDS
ncbi:NERD domain-containing protein [bacterium]|nr:NERD domain-containing protein [bacterium]